MTGTEDTPPAPPSNRRLICLVLPSVVAAAATCLLATARPAGAIAAGPAPAWRLTAEAFPTSVPAAGSGLLLLHLQNIGDASSVASSPITVVDQLPVGLTATRAAGVVAGGTSLEGSGLWGGCAISEEGHVVTCTYQSGATIAPVASTRRLPAGSEGVVGTDALAPAIGIEIATAPLSSGNLTATATISGGGATTSATAGATVFVPKEGEPTVAPFGISSFLFRSSDISGEADTRAGSVPYETGTSFTVSNVASGSAFHASGVVKDFDVDLPPGLVGDPGAVPKCARTEFELRLSGAGSPVCPADTQVGVALVTLQGGSAVELPVFNLVAPEGVAAQFGIASSEFVAFLDAGVHPNSQGEYVVSLDAEHIESQGFVGFDVSFWGDPADASHNALRVYPGQDEAGIGPHGEEGIAPIPSDAPPKPFLRLPTSCLVSQPLTLSAASVEGALLPPFPAASSDEQNSPVSLEGCSSLDFSPSIEVTPESTATDTPTGLELNIRVPQSEDPNGLAEAHVKDAVVTLPPGLTLTPSTTNGLETCSPGQIGIGSVGELERQPACPVASKIGSLEVATPLFEHPLQGNVYLAQQETVEGALMGVYLVVDDPTTGILVKLAGHLELGGQPGVSGLEPSQVRAVFDNDPQFPFSDLKLDLTGGPKASLVTPQACGSANVASELTGWNGTVAMPSSNVLSTSSGCTEGFSPAFSAGTTIKQAGAYTPFDLTFSREDGTQRLGVINVTTPPGFSGDIAGVTICPNSDLQAAERLDQPGDGAIEQANPSCPTGSDVGTVTATVGAGPDSISVTGHEYLAGPYNGAPFDLVAITPAISGPFDLGVVVLRQGLYIDPHTSQATVKSDPIPTALDGVPLDIRSVAVHIGGVGANNKFIFNPTSCAPLAVTGSLISTTGTSAAISSPFQAVNCGALKFQPGFAVSTAGKASKLAGASLHVNLTYPSAPQGTYANIASIKIDLPIQLPARLTTLQKACTARTFEANPAACPTPSLVGAVVVHTPILNDPLSGPVYLVSHGGEAFPDVVMVLQGEGITLTLVGNTDVKKGITSNTFKTLPDAPVSSVEVTLPQGPYSVLAANGAHNSKYDLCGQTLAMPTNITAQNGAVLKQTTQITATGCPKPKVKTAAQLRAQKLAKALKACRRKRGKARRACEKKARHTYGSSKSRGRRRGAKRGGHRGR
jgi:hypothetical protein